MWNFFPFWNAAIPDYRMKQNFPQKMSSAVKQTPRTCVTLR
jgi:hypothetical protein